MYARDFLVESEIEKRAFEIGCTVIENDAYLIEAGVRLNEFDTRSIILTGLSAIREEIEVLEQIIGRD